MVVEVRSLETGTTCNLSTLLLYRLVPVTLLDEGQV